MSELLNFLADMQTRQVLCTPDVYDDWKCTKVDGRNSISWWIINKWTLIRLCLRVRYQGSLAFIYWIFRDAFSFTEEKNVATFTTWSLHTGKKKTTDAEAAGKAKYLLSVLRSGLPFYHFTRVIAVKVTRRFFCGVLKFVPSWAESDRTRKFYEDPEEIPEGICGH